MSEKLTELRVQRKLLEAKADLANGAVNAINRAIALEACPFKVGDVVVGENGKPYTITRITAGWPCENYLMRGRLIKKNGEPGKGEQALYSFNGPWRLRETDPSVNRPREEKP